MLITPDTIVFKESPSLLTNKEVLEKCNKFIEENAKIKEERIRAFTWLVESVSLFTGAPNDEWFYNSADNSEYISLRRRKILYYVMNEAFSSLTVSAMYNNSYEYSVSNFHSDVAKKLTKEVITNFVPEEIYESSFVKDVPQDRALYLTKSLAKTIYCKSPFRIPNLFYQPDIEFNIALKQKAFLEEVISRMESILQ